MWHVLVISSLFFISASGFASNSSEDKALSQASLQLLEAAYTGTTSGVIQALQNGADINAKASHDYLNSLGYDNSYSLSGNTAIALAVSNNHVKVAKILLEHGADANSKDNWKADMLYRAASLENVAMVKLLLQHGAVAESTILYHVVLTLNNLEIVKLLLQHGADPNEQVAEYCQILGCAIREGNLGIVQELLQHGADPNAGNINGPCYLYSCKRRCHQKVWAY